MTHDYQQRQRDNQRLWDERARTFGTSLEATASTAWVRDETLRYLRRLVRSTDRILEVGCGSGHLLSPLAGRCRAFGLDLSEEMLNLAMARMPPVHGLVRGDAVRLPYRDKSFDLVLSSRCLINIPERSMQIAALDEIFRVVRPSGTVVLSENFEEPMGRLDLARKRAGVGPVRRVALFLRLNLAEILEQCAAKGWRVRRIRGYPIGHFFEEVVVSYLARQRWGATSHRLLMPLAGFVARADALASRFLPPFGRTRQSR